MNTDPTRNTIVFEIKRLWKKETFIEQSLSQADDGIQSAWWALQSKTGVRPKQVRRIYSEWEPGGEDRVFLAKTFPGVEITYSFSRPSADGWEHAFAEATRTILASMGEQLVSAAQERRDQGKTSLLPILRTYETGDVFAETIVHRAIGADLAVFLAHVSPIPSSHRGEHTVPHDLNRCLNASITFCLSPLPRASFQACSTSGSISGSW